jgi:predicted glycosyltransferase involved in capsule biosynthesis
MGTDIIIPWRSSGDWWRDASFKYVSRHMQPLHPLYVDDGSTPFSRSGSKNLGAQTTSADYIMFLDADTVIPHDQIQQAFELAKQGYLAYPFTNYHSIGSHKTRLILNHELSLDPQHSDWNITWATGGAMAIPKALFYEMARKAGIEVKNVEGNCYHLWHPRQEENENILNNYKKYQTEYLGE